MNKTVIELIKNVMTRKRIEQQALCKGICSESTLSRYLTRELDMDRLTFNALLQRLGISPSHFITIISEKEYSYFQWKMCLLQAATQSNWIFIKNQLDSYQILETYGNKVLQKQFIFIMQGILAKELEHDTTTAISYFSQALSLTQSDSSHDITCVIDLMSNQEWCALLNLLYLSNSPSVALPLLQDIILRLERNQLEEQEQGMIYPYACSLCCDIILL